MAARPRTLPAAIAPVLVGTAAAVEASDEIRVGAFVAALVGSVFIQIGTNLANDYSDARRGADTADRLGPVRVTSSGLVAPRRVLVATWVAFAVAVAAGIYLATVAGVVILIVGAASILAGVLYTGGPRPYGYAGLGELFVFLFFGLVAVNGSYYVQLERLDWLPFGLSLAVGFLATAILVVNNVRDIETDGRAGKMTLAVRLGRRANPRSVRAADRRRLRGGADHVAGDGRARLGALDAPLGAAGPPPARRRDDADRRAVARTVPSRAPAPCSQPSASCSPPAWWSLPDEMRIAAVEVIPYALPFERAVRDRQRNARASGYGPPATAHRGGRRRSRRGGATLAPRWRNARAGRAVAGAPHQTSSQARCEGDGLGAAARRRGGRDDRRRCRAAAASAGQARRWRRPCFDLAGRISGTPLWRMLRGETLCPVRCNATLAGDSPHEVAAEAARLERARLRDLQAQGRARATTASRRGRCARRWARMRDFGWTPTAPGVRTQAVAVLSAIEPLGIELAEQPAATLRGAGRSSGGDADPDRRRRERRPAPTRRSGRPRRAPAVSPP